MNWDDIRIVDTAARARSLSGAARMLNLSQPQLSRRLRKVEDEIGARLFDRTPQGLRPTVAGSRLIPLAEKMRGSAEAIERALPDLARSGMGVVRLSVDEVRGRLITDHIAALRERLDGIEIEIISAQMHVDHIMRETEIQIRSCLPESETLVVRRLGHMAYAAYGSEAYLAANPAALTEARFAACDWIGLAPDRLWYPEIDQWLARNLAERPSLRVNTMTAALDAVAAGVGLGVLPVFMADRHPALRRVAGPDDALLSDENLVVHRDILREPAVRRTIDAVVALYRDARPQLRGTVERDAA